MGRHAVWECDGMRGACWGAAHLMFIQLSQLTSSPLYVSPFYSSTSCARHGIKSCVKRCRRDGRREKLKKMGVCVRRTIGCPAAVRRSDNGSMCKVWSCGGVSRGGDEWSSRSTRGSPVAPIEARAGLPRARLWTGDGGMVHTFRRPSSAASTNAANRQLEYSR